MKVLAAVISAAATAQSLEDRGSTTAWTSIETAYSSLYDAILTAYSNTNIPGVKKANRLRDFLNKVDNFPTRAAQGTYDLSGAYSSGDLNAFVFDLIPNSVRNFSYQTFDDICLLKNEQVFTIRAQTSATVSGAQTDGTTNFQIPKAGCDTWFDLDDPNKDDQEPGQIDTFVLDVSSLPASCLENLGDIRIWEKDNDGWYPDWFEVTVVDKTACTTTVYSYEGLQWVEFGETSYSQNAAPVVTQS
ncbi:Oidioi.mRNA.OKI2018_I69.chr2.g4055.t1.cds [Oikopleura dioica]|uniref:Oidioi.mRNA.OKI2018_I69.chr2.g4055.t1.cds n=1 Tax=Oikopleura dioica TaxID=34765 RepID=A0ABN7SW42_OIKDI|nr:Oidioi.mRNA.OKI2018_I69.chr2.g4055.t1.cds [Oikopleura dioica]